MNKKHTDKLNQWKDKVKTSKERNYNFETVSGKNNDLLYYPSEISDKYIEKLGFPGQYPYTRGIHPNLYRGKLWTMRQFAGFGSPKETNERFKFLLKNGQTGLSVAFDMPTLMGYDPNHEFSIGEVGHCGVSISNLEDMEILFDGIDLSKVSVSMTINGPAIIVFAFYVAVAKKQGVDISQLRGTLQNDILKEYIAQKEWIFPPKESVRVITDMMSFCNSEMPKYNTISISGYHIREAGSTAAQELAFTLANGFTYVEHAMEAGLDVDDFAPRLSFFFNSHLDFFEEVAKYRAARRIWSKALKYKYGANKRSQMLKYHIQTSGRSLHAQEIDFNDIRTTLQALYAIYDNCNSLHTNAYDEAITTPTEDSVRRAVAIQLIINKELGLSKNENPNQGSFIIEELTDLVEIEVLKEFDRINERGGVLGAMETMYQRSKIQEESLYYEGLKHTGEFPIIGVNTFLNSKGSPTIIPNEVIRSTKKEKENQILTVKNLKTNFLSKSEEKLKKLTNSVLENKNVFKVLMETSKYCSLGQISNSLFKVGGKYRRSM